MSNEAVFGLAILTRQVYYFDSRAAWDHEVGEVDYLEVNRKSGNLYSVFRANDNSGGKTIGDGVWINKK